MGAGSPDRCAVVLCADQAYRVPLVVTLRSLVASGGTSVPVYVLADGIDPESQARIAACLEPLDVHWIDLDHGFFTGLQLEDRRITRVTAARLIAAELLPGWVDRALYLDTDLLIRRDPTELLRTELGSHRVAAVRDPGLPWIGSQGRTLPWEVEQVRPDLPYLNAGVLVLDIGRWRDDELGQRCLDLLRRHRLRWMDQDALNLMLAGEWTDLGPSWNLHPERHEGRAGGQAWVYVEQAELREALCDPAIVHYVGGAKPWLPEGRDRPWAAEWHAHRASLTEWLPHESSRKRRILTHARRVRQRLRAAASVLLRGPG